MKKTNFILLAAGASTRMGQDKALLPYKGQVWLFEQARSIQSSGAVQQLVVVCQPVKREAYQKILQPLETSDFQVQLVINADPLSKPSDSIRCALKEFDSRSGAFVSPVDIPVKSEVIQALLLSGPVGSEVLRPAYQGRPGHPVWVSGGLLKLFSATDTRLDDFLREHGSTGSLRAVSQHEILLNLNTPEAWDDFLKTV